MRVHEQGQRGAQGERGVRPVGELGGDEDAGRRPVGRRRRRHLGLRGVEDVEPAAELEREVDHRHGDHEVDQRVLDERDYRGRAQAGGVGVRRQHGEGDQQRKVAGQWPLPPMPTTSSTAWMPTSCRAIYGIVARMPVSATARRGAWVP